MDKTQIDEMDTRINQLGASLYFDPSTIAHAADAGITDFFVLYAGGRAGVMGDVTAEQVSSAFGFFDPGLVAKVWPTVLATARPSDIVAVFAAAMAHAAELNWDAEASQTVVRLGALVADSVTALGMPLFAGWRAVPRPTTPQGAAAMVVHTLRELRGDVHVQSVAASGMQPIEAEVATRRGSAGLEMHGGAKAPAAALARRWIEAGVEPGEAGLQAAGGQHADLILHEGGEHGGGEQALAV